MATANKERLDSKNYPVKVVSNEEMMAVIKWRSQMIVSSLTNEEEGNKQKKIIGTFFGVDSDQNSIVLLRAIKYEDGRMVLFDHVSQVKYVNTQDFAVSTMEQAIDKLFW